MSTAVPRPPSWLPAPGTGDGTAQTFAATSTQPEISSSCRRLRPSVPARAQMRRSRCAPAKCSATAMPDRFAKPGGNSEQEDSLPFTFRPPPSHLLIAWVIDLPASRRPRLAPRSRNSSATLSSAMPHIGRGTKVESCCCPTIGSTVLSTSSVSADRKALGPSNEPSPHSWVAVTRLSCVRVSRDYPGRNIHFAARGGLLAAAVCRRFDELRAGRTNQSFSIEPQLVDAGVGACIWEIPSLGARQSLTVR